MRALAGSWLCVVLLVSAAGGCRKDSDQAAQRRELLKPIDIRTKREQEREKRRLFDPAGDLLPSGELTAGVNMPKGLRLYRSFENEWYFEAQHVPLAALDRYFAEHLDPTSLERHEGYVTFGNAQTRDEENARSVTVRIAKLAGADTCNVYVQQAAPQRVYPSGPQAEAQLEERRKHAD